MRALLASVAAVVAGGLSAQAVAVESEPNDSPAAATLLSCSTQADGNLVPFDVDYWSFTLTAPSDVTVYVTSRGATGVSAGGTSAEDPVIDLVAPDGTTVLMSSDIYFKRPLAQVGLFPKIDAQGLAPGTYYLAVAGWSAFDVGDYALDLLCVVPRASPFCGSVSPGPSELEPNDAANAMGVQVIDCCRTSAGGIAVSQDEDFWRLDLAVASRIVWSATRAPTSPTPLLDAQLWAYASDGTSTIGFDDDSGPANDPRLELDLQPGSYFVKVRGFSTRTGDYVLTTDCAPLTSIPRLADYSLRGDSSACPGSTGVPLQLVPRANEWPRIGSRFTCDVAGVPGVAVILLGFNAPPPIVDLALVGAPGCQLAVIPELGALSTQPTVAGEAEFGLWLSSNTSLDGLHINLQAAAIDPGANALGVTMSNGLTLVLGVDA